MDFSKTEDRIAACKWYIDRFLDRYKKEGYQLLDLEGFYWVSEKDDTFRDILVQVGDYIRSKKLKLFWIPYWTAKGFDNWKTDKFDIAYIQPNYFFKDEVNYERLDAACAFGKGTNMGLEMNLMNVRWQLPQSVNVIGCSVTFRLLKRTVSFGKRLLPITREV